jgi:hypothetical protein
MANIGIATAADARFTTAGSGLGSLPKSRPSPALTSVAPWLGVA